MNYTCDNCGLTDDEDALPYAKSLSLRLTPGEAYTDKECPKCGALCFPTKDVGRNMKIKVSEAAGRVLNYMVAVSAGGHGLWHDTVATWWIKIDGEDRALNAGWAQSFDPSTDWSQGGPIIERELIEVQVWHNPLGWRACTNKDLKYTEEGDYIDGSDFGMFGPTPLIAAMRCFVVAKLGEEIEVPEELK
jgi:predicted RNA-binding Zn-ribbon protein involved in translation (DUF1610 family)